MTETTTKPVKPSFRLYLKEDAIVALQTLKDHFVNVQSFLRAALIKKANDISQGEM